MNWYSFHFSCRFLSKKLSQGIDLATAENLLHKNYKDVYSNKPLEIGIYKRIASMRDPSRQALLLSIYGELNFDRDNTPINHMRNVRNYLFLLFFVFLLMSYICMTFVIPTFIEIYSIMNSTISAELESFTTYWSISLLLMTLVGLSAIKLSSTIAKLNTYSIVNKSGFLSKLLLSNKIVNKIAMLEALVKAPINDQSNKYSDNANTLFLQLESDGLNIAQELQHQINMQNDELTKLINRRIKRLMFVFSIIVVLAIFNFISSLYAPIFATGTIL